MNSNKPIANDVTVIITSYNQKKMILEAVSSLCNQTLLPAKIIIVDDGSTDQESINILQEIENIYRDIVEIEVIKQENQGVSAARNTGISQVQTELVLILDGDDKLEPSYLQKVRQLLLSDEHMIAASSWMKTFGVLQADIHPSGGTIKEFLSHNCAPATHMFYHQIWKQCGGYDETMKTGFEDWDYFLNMLEVKQTGYIGIIEEGLINYRTTSVSANIKSMSKRLDLMKYIINKHQAFYQIYLTDVILDMEAISISRLTGWESEINNSLANERLLSDESKEFMKQPTYGDGGMAMAVRVASKNR